MPRDVPSLRWPTGDNAAVTTKEHVLKHSEHISFPRSMVLATDFRSKWDVIVQVGSTWRSGRCFEVQQFLEAQWTNCVGFFATV